MTNSVRRLVVAGALLMTGAAAFPRAQGIETVTKVPFAFTAGDTQLPQDRYLISPIPGQKSVFMLRGERNGVVLMSRIDRLSNRETKPSLTFHRYGDQYFLREVQLGDGSILHLTQSRAEKEYLAAQAAAKSTVVVASNLPK